MTHKLTIKEGETPFIIFGGGNQETLGKILEQVPCACVDCGELENVLGISAVQEAVDKADVIIFACPEWNGAYPWMFKKLIDNLKYKSFKGKIMKMIVWSGGNNKAESLRYSLVHLAHFLQMKIDDEYLYLDMA